MVGAYLLSFLCHKLYNRYMSNITDALFVISKKQGVICKKNASFDFACLNKYIR